MAGVRRLIVCLTGPPVAYKKIEPGKGAEFFGVRCLRLVVLDRCGCGQYGGCGVVVGCGASVGVEPQGARGPCREAAGRGPAAVDLSGRV